MSENEQNGELLRRDEILVDGDESASLGESQAGLPGKPIQRIGTVVGEGFASTFSFPPDGSAPRKNFATQLRQVEEAERGAEKEAQGVRLHPIKL